MTGRARQESWKSAGSGGQNMTRLAGHPGAPGAGVPGVLVTGIGKHHLPEGNVA